MTKERPIEERFEAMLRELIVKATLVGDDRWKLLAQAALEGGRYSPAWKAACKEVLRAFDAD